MHESTWDYLKNNLDVASQLGRVEFNGQVSIHRARILFSDICTPTINEGNGYIFPKEKFITYESKDIEWCEFFGIGRWGRGIVLGNFYKMDCSYEVKVDSEKKRKITCSKSLQEIQTDWKQKYGSKPALKGYPL
jgi:hypothetical protein